MTDAQEASKKLIEALSAEIASLKDGAETTINERTEAAVAKERLKLQAEHAAKDATNAQEKDRLLKKLNELQRVVDQHTANQLGDSGERDTGRELTVAFPSDQITQVAKGTKGGDFAHFINHKGTGGPGAGRRAAARGRGRNPATAHLTRASAGACRRMSSGDPPPIITRYSNTAWAPSRGMRR